MYTWNLYQMRRDEERHTTGEAHVNITDFLQYQLTRERHDSIPDEVQREGCAVDPLTLDF